MPAGCGCWKTAPAARMPPISVRITACRSIPCRRAPLKWCAARRRCVTAARRSAAWSTRSTIAFPSPCPARHREKSAVRSIPYRTRDKWRRWATSRWEISRSTPTAFYRRHRKLRHAAGGTAQFLLPWRWRFAGIVLFLRRQQPDRRGRGPLRFQIRRAQRHHLHRHAPDKVSARLLAGFGRRSAADAQHRRQLWQLFASGEGSGRYRPFDLQEQGTRCPGRNLAAVR